MLLLPTAMTGHLPNGSPMSNLPWNGRTARSHSPTRRAHRTSRTLHSPRRSLPRGQADKDSLTRWTLGGRIHEEQPADPRPDLRLQKRAVNDYAISRSRYLAIPHTRTLRAAEDATARSPADTARAFTALPSPVRAESETANTTPSPLRAESETATTTPSSLSRYLAIPLASDTSRGLNSHLSCLQHRTTGSRFKRISC